MSAADDIPPPEWWSDADFRAAVQGVLDDVVDEQAGRLEPLGEDAARLAEEARRSLAGGKRLRAAFCYWGFRAVRGHGDRDEHAALLRAGAALELLHASALVHDDLMDGSDVRRGRPATHRAFAEDHRRHGWRGDPEQYGGAAAILLGDLLLSWADELLRTCGLPPGPVLEALTWFDRTRSEVITGQFLDVSVQARGRCTVTEAMQVLRYKSAKYSVERPLHIGAALAGGGGASRHWLSDFGLPLGEAFQLRDDLLGVFGDPQATGKPAGDDLSEGKRTVLVALALEGAGERDARRLDERLGTPLSVAEVEDLRAVIERSGAAARVEELIDQLTTRSLAALRSATVDAAARGALERLALAATQRTG